MTERRNMQTGDWFNSAANVAIGVLLGSAAHGLVQLITTGFWPVAMILTLIFGGVILFELVSDKLFNRLFSTGIRPATKPQTSGRKPLPRILSLPTGFIFGVSMVALGLDKTLLGIFA